MGVGPKDGMWIQWYYFGRFQLAPFPGSNQWVKTSPRENEVSPTQWELNPQDLAWLALEANISYGLGETGKDLPTGPKGILAGRHLSQPLAGEEPCTMIEGRERGCLWEDICSVSGAPSPQRLLVSNRISFIWKHPGPPVPFV